MTSTLHNMRSMRRVLLAALFVSAGYAPATQSALVVSSDATQNMSCSAGVCTPTATRANLNVADLANMLSQGDVKVLSDSASQDIDFSAPLSWTSASRLILESYRSIVFRRA